MYEEYSLNTKITQRRKPLRFQNAGIGVKKYAMIFFIYVFW